MILIATFYPVFLFIALLTMENDPLIVNLIFDFKKVRFKITFRVLLPFYSNLIFFLPYDKLTFISIIIRNNILKFTTMLIEFT